MKYIVTINGKNYEVEVERGQAQVVKITQNAAHEAQSEASVSTLQSAKASVSPQGNIQLHGVGEAIKAPMPGTILDIKISNGTPVKKGDTLFILEAMKMENEITAPKDGVITQVVVAKGAGVSTGDVLTVLN